MLSTSLPVLLAPTSAARHGRARRRAPREEGREGPCLIGEGREGPTVRLAGAVSWAMAEVDYVRRARVEVAPLAW